MGLAKSDFDVDQLVLKLSQMGDSASRQILATMDEEAKNIAELASEFAPRDDSELDQAIVVRRERTGINGRMEVSVEVDGNRTDKKGRPISKYALIMHEMLQPFGAGGYRSGFFGEEDDGEGEYDGRTYNLGPRSREKDAGRGIVGGKFLERAWRARIGPLGKKVKAIADRVFR